MDIPDIKCANCGADISTELHEHRSAIARAGGIARSKSLSKKERARIARMAALKISKKTRSARARVGWIKRKMSAQ